MKFMSWASAAFLSSAPAPQQISKISSERAMLPALHTTIPAERSVGNAPQSIENYSTAVSSSLVDGIREWLVPSAWATPSPDNVELLQKAMAAFYGQDMAGTGRDMDLALDLLTKTISAWKDQPADERASLFRIRGDTNVALGNGADAIRDYGKAIDLLETPEGDLADPGELPAARLGRARAIRSLRLSATDSQLQLAAKDYKEALRLSSREEWDTDQERQEDGAQRNPYATWEWGHALRAIGDYKGASEAHALAFFAFGEIGDRAHSVMAALDTGIDLAATEKNVDETKSELLKAIKRTASVEGRDVDLLQRVVAKEGEARIALASVLWNSGDKSGAEKQLGDACVRLEQLEADAQERLAKDIRATDTPPTGKKLKFSIDDSPGVFDVSCSRFKNDKFLIDTLEWPPALREKVAKLESLN